MFAVMDALADLVYFLIPKGKQVFFIKRTFFQQIEYFTIYMCFAVIARLETSLEETI